MKPFAHWPTYFATPHHHPDHHDSPGHGHSLRAAPSGQTHTPFAFAWGHAALPPWEVKALYPAYASAFARSMRAREMAGGDTVCAGSRAVYDMAWVGVEARGMTGLAGEEGGSRVVVVDVGGGLGQLVRNVLRDVEGLMAGQCVVQDRREVVEEARAGEGLEGVVLMEHDFHEEQPVKGEYLLKLLLDGNGC